MKPKAEGEKNIAQELQRQRSFSVEDILHKVEQGQSEEAADHLIFFS